MLPKMLEDDRRRAGWSVGRAAWELGVSIREYRELEAGTRWPSWETFDRICKLFG
jgi:predicted transcriptional regulator